MSRAARASAIRGLYGMVDLRPGFVDGAAVRLAEDLIAGGARVLQLRGKAIAAEALFTVGEQVRAVCRAAGALFIVNDRVDLAMALFADGVHLGQDDVPLAAARRVASEDLLIGISTHNLAQVMIAVDAGADYLGFGPCFPTASKENPDPVVGLEQLREACALTPPTIPIVAIGGIGLETIAAAAKAGASAAAVIGAVTSAKDARVAARELAMRFAGAT